MADYLQYGIGMKRIDGLTLGPADYKGVEAKTHSDKLKMLP